MFSSDQVTVNTICILDTLLIFASYIDERSRFGTTKIRHKFSPWAQRLENSTTVLKILGIGLLSERRILHYDLILVTNWIQFVLVPVTKAWYESSCLRET